MATAQPAKLGDIEFDAIIDRTETLTSDVPEYATEEGYSIADNICLKPVELDVTAVFSNAPVTWSERHAASANRVESMIEEIRQLWKSRKPVTFTAAGDSWDDMSIMSVTAPKKAEYGNTVRLQIKLRQATITSSETSAISIKYVRGGETQQNTGAGQKTSGSTGSGSGSGSDSDSPSSSSSSGSRSSLLCSGAKALGIFK